MSTAAPGVAFRCSDEHNDSADTAVWIPDWCTTVIVEFTERPIADPEAHGEHCQRLRKQDGEVPPPKLVLTIAHFNDAFALHFAASVYEDGRLAFTDNRKATVEEVPSAPVSCIAELDPGRLALLRQFLSHENFFGFDYDSTWEGGISNSEEWVLVYHTEGTRRRLVRDYWGFNHRTDKLVRVEDGITNLLGLKKRFGVDLTLTRTGIPRVCDFSGAVDRDGCP